MSGEGCRLLPSQGLKRGRNGVALGQEMAPSASPGLTLFISIKQES